MDAPFHARLILSVILFAIRRALRSHAVHELDGTPDDRVDRGWSKVTRAGEDADERREIARARSRSRISVSLADLAEEARTSAIELVWCL